MISVSTIALVYFTSFSPVPVSGVVDHKVVGGINDFTSRTLLMISPEGLITKDPSVADLLEDQDANLTVDETLDRKIHNLGYSEVVYLVSIRVITEDPVNGMGKGETLQYYVTRDDFNRLTFGDVFSFEVDRFHGATIVNVHD